MKGKYTIVKVKNTTDLYDTFNKLEVSVNKKIGEGYKPYGELLVDGDYNWVLQVMVLKEKHKLVGLSDDKIKMGNLNIRVK